MRRYKIHAVSDTCRQKDALGSEYDKTYSTYEKAYRVSIRLGAEQSVAEGCDMDWDPVEYRVIPAEKNEAGGT